MTTTGISYPHAIVLPSGGPITQLIEVGPSFNLSDLVEFSAGQTAPQFAGAHQAIHELPFGCREIKTVLDGCTVEGVLADYSGGNVDLYYKRGASHGLRVADASTSHLRARMESNALMVWQSFAASQGESATIKARLLPVYDGSNVPLVFTGSVALAGTSAASEIFTLGPVAINGSTLPSLMSIDWQNQITYEEIASGGEEYITYGGVKRFSPVITLRTRDATAVATYGQITNLTSLSVYLRKKDSAGFNVADGTAEHIKFTATSGTVRARGVSGTDAMVEIQIHLTKPNASSAPFTKSTTSAIT